MKVCVLGATGRMGLAIRAVAREQGLDVIAVDRVASDGVSTDLHAALTACDVYIDFTSPAATREAALLAAKLGRAAVIGTTGLGAGDEATIAALARVAPVVFAANFSLGVNVLLGLVERAAAALGPDWDAEIVETHHKHKVDAPSGTALALVRALERAGAGPRVDGRSGQVGARTRGEIGVHAVRGGDVVGEHTVSLFAAGERLELTHRATDRTIFARGAVRAATWVVGKPAGAYDMQHVLGLR